MDLASSGVGDRRRRKIGRYGKGNLSGGFISDAAVHTFSGASDGHVRSDTLAGFRSDADAPELFDLPTSPYPNVARRACVYITTATET